MSATINPHFLYDLNCSSNYFTQNKETNGAYTCGGFSNPVLTITHATFAYHPDLETIYWGVYIEYKGQGGLPVEWLDAYNLPFEINLYYKIDSGSWVLGTSATKNGTNATKYTYVEESMSNASACTFSVKCEINATCPDTILQLGGAVTHLATLTGLERFYKTPVIAYSDYAAASGRTIMNKFVYHRLRDTYESFNTDYDENNKYTFQESIRSMVIDTDLWTSTTPIYYCFDSYTGVNGGTGGTIVYEVSIKKSTEGSYTKVWDTSAAFGVDGIRRKFYKADITQADINARSLTTGDTMNIQIVAYYDNPDPGLTSSTGLYSTHWEMPVLLRRV